MVLGVPGSNEDSRPPKKTDIIAVDFSDLDFRLTTLVASFAS